MDRYSLQKFRTPDDLGGMYQLMCNVFGREGVDLIIKRLLGYYPEMSLDHVMAVEHEGETVAALVMIPQTWVLDGLALRVAEMGCVATHHDYRRQGLQRMLNEQFDIFARRNGFDLCALAGIPYFYRQFGYEYAVDLDHSTSINADTITYQASSLEIRPFRETDIEAASRMLEDAQSRYHVRSPRTEAVWLMQQRTGHYNSEPFNSVAFIEDCELKAYMRYALKKGEGSFILKEAVLESPKYVSDVLSFVKEACQKYGLNKVVSMQFYGDEPTLTLISLGGESVRPYAWQVNILDYLGLLRKLVPLLELRLLRAGYGNLTETLNLNFRKFNIRVKVELGKIVCLEENNETGDRSIGLNPYVFPQLLLGYRSVGELIESYPDVRVSDSYKAIVEALFPKGQGYIFHIY